MSLRAFHIVFIAVCIALSAWVGVWGIRDYMAVMSVYNGLRMRVVEHRRIARWTFPIWMYVSVTGVLVYFFLYQWFPSG